MAIVFRNDGEAQQWLVQLPAYLRSHNAAELIVAKYAPAVSNMSPLVFRRYERLQKAVADEAQVIRWGLDKILDGARKARDAGKMTQAEYMGLLGSGGIAGFPIAVVTIAIAAVLIAWMGRSAIGEIAQAWVAVRQIMLDELRLFSEIPEDQRGLFVQYADTLNDRGGLPGGGGGGLVLPAALGGSAVALLVAGLVVWFMLRRR